MSSNHTFPAHEWETKHFRIRQFRDTDADALAAACSDTEIQRFLPNMPNPYTIDDARYFIKNVAEPGWDKGEPQWAITDLHTDKYLASIGAPRVTWAYNSAEIGYLVAPWARGTGIAAQATASVTEFLFSHGIERVELHIDPANLASQRTALRAGFIQDAKLRSGLSQRDGGRTARIIYSRLPSDQPGPAIRALPDLPAGELSDGVISLKPLSARDMGDCFALQNLEDVWQNSMPPVPPQHSAIKDLCQFGSQSDWLAGRNAAMSIRNAQSDEFAGVISVHLLSPLLREAMLGYSLDTNSRGQGFATRAVRLVTAWAFEQIGLERVIAGTISTNVNSQAVLSRAGFTREGVERSRLLGPNDTRLDNIGWSILKGEL